MDVRPVCCSFICCTHSALHQCSSQQSGKDYSLLYRQYSNNSFVTRIMTQGDVTKHIPVTGGHSGVCQLHLQPWRGLQPGYCRQSILVALLGCTTILDQRLSGLMGYAMFPSCFRVIDIVIIVTLATGSALVTLIGAPIGHYDLNSNLLVLLPSKCYTPQYECECANMGYLQSLCHACHPVSQQTTCRDREGNTSIAAETLCSFIVTSLAALPKAVPASE